MSKKLPVGIQVYGLRDLLENTPENFKNVMQQVKDLGYDGVELAGLYGLTPEYVKEVLEKKCWMRSALSRSAHTSHSLR